MGIELPHSFVIESAAHYSALRCVEDGGDVAMYEAGMADGLAMLCPEADVRAAVARYRELVGSEEIAGLVKTLREVE